MEDLLKIKTFYEENVYGIWRSGEKVSYTVYKESKREVIVDPDNPFLSMFKLSTVDDGIDVEIHVEKDGTKVTFTVRVYLPPKELKAKYNSGFPFIVCMHPVGPKDFALENGYAMIFMDTSMIAEDNCFRRGCFYDLYPYTAAPDTQTGELMAWGWGAAKVLDAIENGLGEEFGLNSSDSSITGVSRWGKATAVCGAFEERFKNVIPVCSGAGGLALWKVSSEGNKYDLSDCGGPEDYVYGRNEPLDCLQSDAERGWFKDRFLEYKKYEDIPVEQYMLPVLAASSKRNYFIVAAWTGEDWVNAPAMWECFKEAEKLYEELGLAGKIHAFFHKEGHALLREDLEKIFTALEG